MLHEAKMSKRKSRCRRARRTRAVITASARARLHVHRTPQHIRATVYAVDAQGLTRVLACASSLEKTIRTQIATKTAKATLVGELLAQRAMAAGVNPVAFDRSGFKYHGRIKALADAARAGGIDF
jgi:large subunit ribosomal protein L18